MKWYIGQKVVGISSGKIRTVIGIKKPKCKCEGVELVIKELSYGTKGWYCDYCNCRGSVIGNSRHERAFRPLEDNFAEEVLEKALKEGIKLADEL